MDRLNRLPKSPFELWGQSDWGVAMVTDRVAAEQRRVLVDRLVVQDDQRRRVATIAAFLLGAVLVLAFAAAAESTARSGSGVGFGWAPADSTCSAAVADDGACR